MSSSRTRLDSRSPSRNARSFSEAMSKGLLTRVLPDADVATDVMQLARRLAAGAPMAARINKQTVTRLSPQVPPLTEAELLLFFKYAESRDHREGVRAFGWPAAGIEEIDLEGNANLYALLAAGFPADRAAVAIETPTRSYSWNDIEEISARYANLLQYLSCLPVRVLRFKSRNRLKR